MRRAANRATGQAPIFFRSPLDLVTNVGEKMLNPAVNPGFQVAYYLHNFKGAGGGSLFRAFPGPWTVVAGEPGPGGGRRVVHVSEERPTLKAVALEILPRARAEAEAAARRR